MSTYAGSMRTGATSRAETIQVNNKVCGIPNKGERALLLCRTYATIAYVRDNAVCRTKYAVQEAATSLLFRTVFFFFVCLFLFLFFGKVFIPKLGNI